MKTAVSIPDRLFKDAEALAARLRVSRSELFARAVKDFVDRHREETITTRLNEVYGDREDDSRLDSALLAAQIQSIRPDDKRW